MAAMNLQLVLRRTLFTHSTRICKTPSVGCVYRTYRPMSATTESASQNAEGGKEAVYEASEGTETERHLQDIVANLSKEKESLTKEVADYQDKYQRTLADRENVRNRLEKQIADAKQYGIQGFCKDLLEVSDVFHKAIESVPPEKIQEGSSDLKTLYDGLVRTESQLLSVFRRHGLEQILPQVGEKFDPSVQEAMFELSLPDKEPGTVAHIVRSGWSLHSRCIRSAQVGVVKS